MPPRDRAKLEERYRGYIQDRRTNPKELAREFDRICWEDTSRLRQLPAELASLRVIQNYCAETERLPLNKHDRLTLVYADNENAEFCANVIQMVLAEENSLGDKLLGDILIEPPWELNGFDPSNALRLQGALGNLWHEFFTRMSFLNGVKRKYYLNLTGGYKFIVMLFACFGSMMGQNHNRIFYLNDEAGTDVVTMEFNLRNSQRDALGINNIDARGQVSGETIGPHDF